MEATATGAGEPLYICEMMKRLGIDPGAGALGPQSLKHLTALQQCRTCTAKETCRAWLDGTPKPTRLAPSFCPNAEVFFELHATRAGSFVPPSEAF